jgi:hypothetical protein
MVHYNRERDLGDYKFGMLYQNHQFAHLFGTEGQPALSPAWLALVTVMQYIEGVGDRQAADNVRDASPGNTRLARPSTTPASISRC